MGVYILTVTSSDAMMNKKENRYLVYRCKEKQDWF